MNRISTFAALLLCVSALFSSCIKDRGDTWEIASGSRIPKFTVNLSDGTTVSSADLGDCVSLIFFFHTGCPDCRRTMPAVQSIYDKYSQMGVVFVPISRAESQTDVASYWKDAGLTMPYSAQRDRKVYELFAKSRIPRVYLCRNGIIEKFYTDSPTPADVDLDSDLQILLFSAGNAE